MEYHRQLTLPFDKGERHLYDISYEREFQRAIDEMTFYAKDVFKNSKRLIDSAENLLEVSKRNYNNIVNKREL
jgi:hypothetical protein|tara:strand:+ start:160 stop:378 length:219 start_codon:yes stop_codon:yes gene_type:complete